MGPKEREKQTCTKSVMYRSSLGIAHFALSSFSIIEARALSPENVVMHWKVVTLSFMGVSSLRGYLLKQSLSNVGCTWPTEEEHKEDAFCHIDHGDFLKCHCLLWV